MHTRRSILKTGGLMTLGSAVLPLRILRAGSAKPLFPDGYPDRKDIISAAIESALAAGASYADARLSHNETYAISSIAPYRTEAMALGVRALYQGYWGFAASPIWSNDEAARLGVAAVAQARANVLGRERNTELAPIIGMTNGHWETPIKDDPFKIDDDELVDFVGGLIRYLGNLKYVSSINSQFGFNRINKAFGSSNNQFTTQVLYSTFGYIGWKVSDYATGEEAQTGSIDEMSIAGEGFEYLRERPIREYLRILNEEAIADMRLPWKPIDVGRYNVLIDQCGVAHVLAKSIGRATEVDRVFGFEANAGGTSYIEDPETSESDARLGTFKVGSPLLNVTCDRSQQGSVGRVRWDDEGVEPVKYDLVKDGVLTNLQTNREGASWLKNHYQRTGQPLRSFGAATCVTALDVPLVQGSDLSMAPGNKAVSRDDLRVALGNGVEFRTPSVTLDFQQVTGFLRGGNSYEIKNGKRIAKYRDAGMLFRTSELWKNIMDVGGAESVKYYGLQSEKGQPPQKTYASVYAPPATFKDATLVDVRRKA